MPQISKWMMVILIALLSCSQKNEIQNVIFLHHSTGGNVYKEGTVKEWIDNYNQENGSNIVINERAYPNEPYKWKNYPFDYWNLWINGECDSSQPGIECMNTLAAANDVIIFKHCFPGAHVYEDTGNPDINSERHTLENYKLQYRALREFLNDYPDNTFIVWTLAPLHRLTTNPEDARRAGEFVDWVNNEWLQEDGKKHKNILVFDFWGLSAELNENPSQGQVNCLRYEYEKDHDSKDSHPNLKANEAIGPVFAEFIVKAVE